MLNPGTEALIIAPTHTTAAAVELPAFEKFAGELIVSWNKNECWYELANGTRVWWASFDRPRSYEGRNVSAMWIDEAQLANHEAWRVAAGRLRVRAPRMQGIVTATPVAGTWLQREFDSGKSDRAFIRATSFDNTFLDPGWAESLLKSYSKADADAYVRGMWTATTGLVYPEYSREKHLIDYKPNPDIPVLVGVDFGYRWPAVVYAQRTRDGIFDGPREIPRGSIVVFDEDVIEGISTEQLTERIIERCRGFTIGALYVDPAGSQTGQSGADHAGPTEVTAMDGTFRAHGMNPWIDYLAPKGNAHLRSINAGIEKVRAYMQNARGEAKLYFSRDLERQHQGDERGLMRMLAQYQWRQDRQQPHKASPPGNVHHVADALRYLIRHVALIDEGGSQLRVERYA